MSEFTIYHNPRCSKSRATLALLEAQGIEPEVVLYLENPPSAAQIRGLLEKLAIPAEQLVRRGEDEYQQAGLGKNSSTEELVAAMAKYPRLIERPVVVHEDRAVLGRPPENVLALLD